MPNPLYMYDLAKNKNKCYLEQKQTAIMYNFHNYKLQSYAISIITNYNHVQSP